MHDPNLRLTVFGEAGVIRFIPDRGPGSDLLFLWEVVHAGGGPWAGGGSEAAGGP
jgi:hypothetical protein